MPFAAASSAERSTPKTERSDDGAEDRNTQRRQPSQDRDPEGSTASQRSCHRATPTATRSSNAAPRAPERAPPPPQQDLDNDDAARRPPQRRRRARGRSAAGSAVARRLARLPARLDQERHPATMDRLRLRRSGASMAAARS